jgi:branched-chain amino acid transport system permease protein
VDRCAGALIVYVLLANLLRSGVGRAFRAVRDDEVAAALAGLHVARVQVLAFVVSSGVRRAGGRAVRGRDVACRARGVPARRCRSRCSRASILGGLGSLAGAVWGRPRSCSSPPGRTTEHRRCRCPTNVQANLSLAVYGVVLIA